MKILQLNELDDVNLSSIFDDVVVIPTETVYGLSARIDNEKALKNIFKIKGRPSDNPLIVHISDVTMLDALIKGDIPKEYQILMDRFWPGPLTLLFPASDIISKTITGNSSTFIAVRMPKSPYLRKLISRLNCPLAAPSANSSGKPSPTTVDHVIHDLGDKVTYYINGGPCEVGLESTIFGIIDNDYFILRPGGVTKEQIEECLGIKTIIKNKVNKEETVICPGQKYKHYSPNNPVYLFKGKEWCNSMMKLIEANKNKQIGLLKRKGIVYPMHSYKEFELGESLQDISRNFFAGLRALDQDCDMIFVVAVDLIEEGLAIMDRLEKAASYEIY